MQTMYVLLVQGKVIGVFDSEMDAQIHASFHDIDNYVVQPAPYYGEWQYDCGVLS